MKTNNIFDYMDKDSSDIDEMTILENTGVKTENVREIFMNKVNAQNKQAKTKKTGRKKTFIVLAAAVAATLALGTVGAGAAGSFNSVFGERFAGEKTNGVYGGANVNINTADGYNTEFLGISGDHHTVLAALNITKADGSSFVKGDDVKYTYIMPFLYGVFLDDEIERTGKELGMTDEDYEYVGKVEVQKSLWKQLTSGSSDDSGGAEYFVTDDGAIKCIMEYEALGYDLIGENMSVYEPAIYLYNVKRDILKCNAQDAYEVSYVMTEDDDTADEMNTGKVAEIVRELEETKKTMNDNEYLVFNIDNMPEEKKVTFSVVEIQREVIDLSGSWKLNYKAEPARSIEVKDNEFTLEGSYNGHDFSEVKLSVINLEADAFNASVRFDISGNVKIFDDPAEYTSDNKWVDEFYDSFRNETYTITLENGEVVEAWFSLNNMSYDENGGSIVGAIVYNKNYDIVTLCPNEIVSISLNGVELI